MSQDALMSLAHGVLNDALSQGAEQAAVAVSRSTQTTIERREGKVEQATEATARGLSLSVLADGRYTSNSTSDLRPEALKHFIARSVQAASFLEPDPDHALPDRALCGRGATDAALEQDDPAWATHEASDREARAERIEAALLALGGDDVVSSTASIADGHDEVVKVLSNGFADHTGGAWFTASGTLVLHEGDKRPTDGAHFAARYLSDLPDPAALADEVNARARRRLNAGPAPSGVYPMLLDNKAVGRLLGVLAGPMSGGALHEGRSCLADRIGQPIASPALTITDDPTIPRGLGSRPWTGDCLVARPRTIVDAGVLRSYNIGVYYGRKLGMDPTGGRSNWVIAPGSRSPEQMAADHPQVIKVTGFLGGNSNGSTGDFSFGIRGLLLERGEVVQSLSEMNVAGNILTLLGQLTEVGADPWLWSTVRSPSLLFEGVQFSGS